MNENLGSPRSPKGFGRWPVVFELCAHAGFDQHAARVRTMTTAPLAVLVDPVLVRLTQVAPIAPPHRNWHIHPSDANGIHRVARPSTKGRALARREEAATAWSGEEEEWRRGDHQSTTRGNI